LVLVALLAVQNLRPAQTAATRQSLQSLLQVEVVVVVLRPAQMDKWAVLVAARAVEHYLGLVLQTKVFLVGHKTLITTHIQVAVAVLAR
jgi:hypothetical protein